jgi:hypothetical protein
MGGRRGDRGEGAGVRLALTGGRGAVGWQGVLEAAAEEGCQDPEQDQIHCDDRERPAHGLRAELAGLGEAAGQVAQDERGNREVEQEEGGQQGQRKAVQGAVQEAVEVVRYQPGGHQGGGPDVVHLVKGELGMGRGGRLQPVHDLSDDVLSRWRVEWVEGVGAPVVGVEGVAVFGGQPQRCSGRMLDPHVQP